MLVCRAIKHSRSLLTIKHRIGAIQMIQVGDKLPDVNVTVAAADGHKTVGTGELFAGKKRFYLRSPALLPRPALLPICPVMS